MFDIWRLWNAISSTLYMLIEIQMLSALRCLTANENLCQIASYCHNVRIKWFTHAPTHGKTHALLQHSTALISGSVQDNVATPVTAMMVTVSLYQHWCLICIHQSWFIWYNSFHQWLLVHHTCYSLFLQTATVFSQHTCIILLHQTDTALTNPTDCSSLIPSVLNSL